VNPNYLLLPNCAIAKVRAFAAERGIPVERFLEGAITRIDYDPDFKTRCEENAEQIFGDMNAGRRTDHLSVWPDDITEMLGTALVLGAKLEQECVNTLMWMSGEQLEEFDELSRRLGKDFDQLAAETILSLPQNRPLPAKI
jgi:hypothetical protein